MSSCSRSLHCSDWYDRKRNGEDVAEDLRTGDDAEEDGTGEEVPRPPTKISVHATVPVASGDNGAGMDEGDVRGTGANAAPPCR